MVSGAPISTYEIALRLLTKIVTAGGVRVHDGDYNQWIGLSTIVGLTPDECEMVNTMRGTTDG